MKLSRELSRRGTGRTLYILDEPTTGLHFEDIAQAARRAERLVDQGNTIVVIEHNLDVIKSADWVIDLGPARAARAAAGRGPRHAGGGGQVPERPSAATWASSWPTVAARG